MIQVEIAELKARLSEYLARVQAGEEIVVADRGGPLPASCLRNGADRARTLGSSISNAEDCCEWARECCPRNFGIWGRPEDTESKVLSALEADRADRQ